jgi:3-oxoacyl-[acyl-carrier protein] reductase
MSKKFTGSVALITGGASGIGLEATKLFCENGATVAVNFLPSDSRALHTCEQLIADGYNVHRVPGDISIPNQPDNIVAETVSALGRLDILINNAGTAVSDTPIPFAELDKLDEEFWSKILNTNLLGPFRCSRAAAPHLISTKGCIINTASIAGLGNPGSSIAYNASKAALINLTKSLAYALKPDVRVNAVAPGQVRTPWTQKWPEKRRKNFIDNSLLQRLVDAKDIGYTMLFLATNSSITNQTIVVDCGRTI